MSRPALSIDPVEREAVRILNDFARQRSLRPLRTTRAWESPRPLVYRVTAAELRVEWQQLRQAIASGNPDLVAGAQHSFTRDLLAFLET